MIAQTDPEPGSRTHALLSELYGLAKGRVEEKFNAHLITAWDPFVPDPATDRTVSLADLARQLDRPVAVTGPLVRHVWHCAVRAAPDDPRLTDVQWAGIAVDIVGTAGIAPSGDDQACRWIALRHAADHIHIVATLTRQDGRKPNLRGNWFAMRAACCRAETRYGLRRTTPPSTGDVRPH
ncbi:mobilization protein [Planomonospora sphaerica]|uniref:Mobilization protein n=1 Tax=Planomonospora sphaerica TaxID=161355 RepID=A0A161MDQ0_9ACTN|nr:hypothetical protein [Planomonospora sphaerica]GAT69823.1 mobilization protein [Planomonospora sphaerica]